MIMVINANYIIVFYQSLLFLTVCAVKDFCYCRQGSADACRFVEDFVIAQLQGEELYKILKFEYPDKVLERIFMSQGEEVPVAR